MEPGTVAIWWVFLGSADYQYIVVMEQVWSPHVQFSCRFSMPSQGSTCVLAVWTWHQLHTQPGLGNRARESRGLLHWHVGYTVSADDLVTKGAKTSTAMVWTKAMSFFVITMIFNFKKHIGELGFIFCPFKVISRFCLSLVNSIQYHIDGLAQERHNSIANALELRLSCTYPSI